MNDDVQPSRISEVIPVSSLMTEEGRDYLALYYVKLEHSACEVARTLGTYTNKVLKALKHHGFDIRDRSEARKAGLKTGRVDPPMLGKGHTQEARARISASMLARRASLVVKPQDATVSESRSNDGTA